jgi:peptide/nickel transport system ATP-binding protein
MTGDPDFHVEKLRVTQTATGVRIIDDVSFRIRAGQVLGIVGETGAGKTLTVRGMLGLLPPGIEAAGTLRLGGGSGIDLADALAVRGLLGRELTCVLQNPYSMLDPRQRLGRQLVEGAVVTGRLGRADAQARALDLLARMGFRAPHTVLRLYPHQLSGGMAQRVACAMGLMPRPRLLLLDEPTSALDAGVRLDVLSLFRRLAQEERAGVLMVSHDLGSVRRFCERTLVMYAGRVAEVGPTSEVTGRPLHPYTTALLRSSATFDVPPRQALSVVPGAPPAPGARPPGCAFGPRCPEVISRCREELPGLLPLTAGHLAACHRAEELLGRPSAEPVPPPGPEAEAPAMDVTVPADERPRVEVTKASASYRQGWREVPVLREISFDVAAGQTLAVIGESGAGKSTLVGLLAGFRPPSAGTVLVEGRPPRPRTGTVSPVQVVFQNPGHALNPYASIGRSIAEPLRNVSKEERRAEVSALLRDVGVDPARAGERPRGFSGGQLQRVVLARALAAKPSILVCDEATSALDVSVQAQILNLLMALQRRLRFAMIFVTHDLSVARVVADSVLVLREGDQEELTKSAIFFGTGPGTGPRSEYGRELLRHTTRTPVPTESGAVNE